MSDPTKDLITELKTEVFNLIIGYEDQNKIQRRHQAVRKSLQARRAIEHHFEEKSLANQTTESWFID